MYFVSLKNKYNPANFYEVVYNVGYATIPKEIEQVCKEMVYTMYQDSGIGGGNLLILDETTNMGGNSVNQKSAKQYLDYKHKVILQSYRIASI